MSANESRVAVVTGAARGIGLAIVRRFVSEGFRVVMVDIDNETMLSAAHSMGASDRVRTSCADVSVPNAVEAARDAALKHSGRVDALVNNAGVAVFKPLLQTSFEE